MGNPRLFLEAELTMEVPDSTPKHNDLVYDVGMHKGEDSEFYLRKGFRVVAFEANAELIVSCKQRLKEFLDSGQLTIIEGAIVDPALIAEGSKTVRFYQNPDSSVWGTVSAEWAERNARLGMSSKVTEVAAIDFVAVMRQSGVPYYMKIDIEGCDTVCIDALRGFQERPTYISIESDKTSLENAEREIDLFMELGYGSFQAVEQSQIPKAQLPPQPAREGKYTPHRFEKGSSGLFGLELKPEWKSKHEVMRQYRLIFLGYYLLGDYGVLGSWRFPGARQARGLVRRVVRLLTHATVPGWYDTHARLSDAKVSAAGAAR
jgi:FkbM family methyltransferase